MLIADGGSPNLLVVSFLNRANNQVFPVTDLGHLPENLDVFVMVSRAPDDERHINGIGYLLDYLGSFVSAAVKSIGVGAYQLQAYHLGPVIINALLCPGNRVIGYTGKRLQGSLRPLLGGCVKNLHGDFG